MRYFINTIFTLLVSLSLISCGLQEYPVGKQKAEEELIGTWISNSDTRIFTFAGDNSYIVEGGREGLVTGEYRVVGNQMELEGTRFILEDSDYNITFYSGKPEFVLDYGDGLISTATFYRKP